MCCLENARRQRYGEFLRPAMWYEIWRLRYLLRTSRAPGESSCTRSHFRELRQEAANLEIRKGMVVDVTKLSYLKVRRQTYLVRKEAKSVVLRPRFVCSNSGFGRCQPTKTIYQKLVLPKNNKLTFSSQLLDLPVRVLKHTDTQLNGQRSGHHRGARAGDCALLVEGSVTHWLKKGRLL